MSTSMTHRVATLSENQRRMLGLAAGGASVAEIARRLALSVHAVERDQDILLTTLGVRTPSEARVLWWGSRAGAPAALVLAAQELLGGDPAQ